MRAFMVPRVSRNLFHQCGAAPLRLVLNENTETPRHFLIGFYQPAHITAETILVELVVCLRIPEAAAIRADLVSQHNAHHVALIEATELDLEVHKADAHAEEKAGHEDGDAQRQRAQSIGLTACP